MVWRWMYMKKFDKLWCYFLKVEVDLIMRIYLTPLLLIGLTIWNCNNSANQNTESDIYPIDYLLEDINSSSLSYGNQIGPTYFENQITLNYFGHFNWGTCSARFGQLNDIVNDLKSQYYPVELIGIGKESHINNLGNWTNNNNTPVCSDKSPFPIWTGWSASQRELYILDQNMELVFRQNITSGLPNNLSEIIKNLIDPQTTLWSLESIHSMYVLKLWFFLEVLPTLYFRKRP